jgi:Pretoxin HINT domain
LDNGATAIGKQLYLELPEMGIVGNASVLAFAPNRLDTRLWHENQNGDYIDRPITGKFEHQSPVVLWLNCPDIEPIGTTPNHSFWSEDRQTYIKASDLQIGEHLHTQNGITVLSQKRLEQKQTTVYNLEVYRDHNYLVTSSGVLVHNSYEGKTPTKREKSTKQLRKEWEENTGEKWPKEPENLNKDQVVSHIEPLQDGGLDGYSNIEPVPAKAHHQAHKDNGDY